MCLSRATACSQLVHKSFKANFHRPCFPLLSSLPCAAQEHAAGRAAPHAARTDHRCAFGSLSFELAWHLLDHSSTLVDPLLLVLKHPACAVVPVCPRSASSSAEPCGGCLVVQSQSFCGCFSCCCCVPARSERLPLQAAGGRFPQRRRGYVPLNSKLLGGCWVTRRLFCPRRCEVLRKLAVRCCCHGVLRFAPFVYLSIRSVVFPARVSEFWFLIQAIRTARTTPAPSGRPCTPVMLFVWLVFSVRARLRHCLLSPLACFAGSSRRVSAA